MKPLEFKKFIEKISAEPCSDGWKAKCPVPEHQDKNPSLHISISESGKVLVKCRTKCASKQDKVIAALVKAELWPVETVNNPNSFRGSTTDKTKGIQQAKEIWLASHTIQDAKSEIAHNYFQNRGLTLGDLPYENIRFHPELPYFEEGKELGKYPAWIAKVLDFQNNFIGIQRGYLDLNGKKASVKEPKKALGKIDGGAVQLSEFTNELAVTEGVETALAVQLATGIPTVATISASGMINFQVPSTVALVRIFADKDLSLTGEEAAKALARKLTALGIEVIIHMPSPEIPEGKKGIDWLDVLNLSGSKPFFEALKNDKAFASKKTTRTDSTEPQPSREVFHGLMGQFVELVGPQSEADPMALLIQLMVVIGSIIGRGPYFKVESTFHRVILFIVLVGSTSKGRKGTSWGHVTSIARLVDELWAKDRTASGLSSGEGLIAQVKDPITRLHPIKKQGRIEGYEEVIEDPGVEDKRCLIIESEFASPLKVIQREGNTLSPVVRDAWDGNDLGTLTKNNRIRATNPHISINGHITQTELLRELNQTEVANGFANRFAFFCVKRSKCLPEGGSVNEEQLQSLARQIKEAVTFAKNVQQVRFDEDARRMWHKVYPTLSQGRPGMLGNLTGRAEAQVIRFSLIYALLDKSSLIKPDHLLAALALWQYSEDSCAHIFGDRLGNAVADEIYSQLSASATGLTRTEMRDAFSRNRKQHEIDSALQLLESLGLAFEVEESSGGRPVERWFASSQKNSSAGERASRFYRRNNYLEIARSALQENNLDTPDQINPNEKLDKEVNSDDMSSQIQGNTEGWDNEV